jgi:hypothetical protein
MCPKYHPKMVNYLFLTPVVIDIYQAFVLRISILEILVIIIHLVKYFFDEILVIYFISCGHIFFSK